MDDGPIYSRKVALLEAAIGDELVALDRQAGLCFGFNPVATDVWQMLSEPQSADRICAQLLARYDVAQDQCRAEVGALLQSMQKLGLIEVAGPG